MYIIREECHHECDQGGLGVEEGFGPDGHHPRPHPPGTDHPIGKTGPGVPRPGRVQRLAPVGSTPAFRGIPRRHPGRVAGPGSGYRCPHRGLLWGAGSGTGGAAFGSGGSGWGVLSSRSRSARNRPGSPPGASGGLIGRSSVGVGSGAAFARRRCGRGPADHARFACVPPVAVGRGGRRRGGHVAPPRLGTIRTFLGRCAPGSATLAFTLSPILTARTHPCGSQSRAKRWCVGGGRGAR